MSVEEVELCSTCVCAFVLPVAVGLYDSGWLRDVLWRSAVFALKLGSAPAVLVAVVQERSLCQPERRSASLTDSADPVSR